MQILHDRRGAWSWVQELPQSATADAFAQVADALRALAHDAETLSAQVNAMHTAQEALRLVTINYKSGLANYLQVMISDGLLLQAKVGYTQAVAQRFQDTVALYVALGGGWWNAPKPVLQGL